MITYTGHGWSELTIENVAITPSYITDVPYDILEAAIIYKRTQCAAIYFDGEGESITLVFTPYNVHGILEGDTTRGIQFDDLDPSDVLEELTKDIIDHRDDWVKFLVEDDIFKINNEFDTLIKELNAR